MLFTFSGCDSCSLKKEWPRLKHPKMPVTLPSVQSDIRILVIGEGPGATEDEQGKVFVGDTGQYLRSKIPQEWLPKLYWQNVVRCKPHNNATPTEQQISCCSTYLKEDLLRIRPHAILAIGTVALQYFWRDIDKISDARGVPFPIQLPDNSWTWCFSTFHPSYVKREEKYDENRVEPIFRTDLIKFFNSVDKFLTPPSPPKIPQKHEVCYPKSLPEVQNLFDRLKEPFGMDFETSKLKPYHRDAKIVTAAFSDGTTHFAFPIWWPGVINTWGNDALAYCLSKNRCFVAHNAPFELVWSWWNYKDCSMLVPYEDSQAAARIKYERNTLLSLNDQTKIHVGKSIKDVTEVDAKRILSYPLDQVLYYNLLDAWGCREAQQRIDLTPVEYANYKRIIEVQRSTVTMELLGVPVDLHESQKLKVDLDQKKKAIEETVQALPEVKQYSADYRKPFLISSTMDVAKVLTQYCGINLPKTEKGNYSSSEAALEAFAGKHGLVDGTLDYREITKLLSTYVEVILNGSILGIDGLIHSSYTTTLTFTTRLSSQDPNNQNWPKRKHREIRKQIKAPKGYVFVSFDYGQLEARTTAMLAKDMKLIANFINKEDIHSRWLNRIIELYPPYLERLAKKLGQMEEKKLRKAGRDQIKIDAVFASIYGSVPKSISNNTGIPLDICEQFQREFFKEYDATKRWIDNQLQVYLRCGQVETLTGLVRNQVLPGNETTNTPSQGSAAEIVQDAQIAIWYEGIRQNEIDLLPRMQIHDDLTFIMRDDSDLEKKVDLVGKEMVKPRYDFSICPLTVEGKMGEDWYNMEDIGVWEGDYIHG